MLSPYTRDNNENCANGYHRYQSRRRTRGYSHDYGPHDGYHERSRDEFGLQVDSAEALSHSVVTYKRVGNCLKQEGLEWWPGTELNRRRQPFQGCALPAELPGLVQNFILTES
jgi:hypothetical protein